MIWKRGICLLLLWFCIACGNKDVKKHISYFSNGKISTVSTYKNGKKEGVFAIFRDSGDIEEIKEYKNDSLVNYALFDEEGFCYKSSHDLLQSTDQSISDSIDIYTFELGFKNEPIGETEVVIDLAEPAGMEKFDSVKVLIPKEGFSVKYSTNIKEKILKGIIIDKVSLALDSFEINFNIPFGFEIEPVPGQF
ncbi:MAG: hypothetical protein RIG62_06490 [Cyclobacteriaceae bacterium]